MAGHGAPAPRARARPRLHRRRDRPGAARRRRARRRHLIVLDASAAVDLVLQTRSSKGIEAALRGEDIRAPVHLDAEVFNALRRLVRSETVPLADAMVALDDLRRLLVTRHTIGTMVYEAMALRDRFGGHDVFFAILARQLGATLVTSDARLARAAEGYVRVRAFV